MTHPIFGNASLAFLRTCDHRLVVLAEEAIRTGMDFAVLCGNRGEQAQNDYFRRGLSTKQFPDSKHNIYPSLAIDVAPWPIDWNDTERFYHLIGIVRRVAVEADISIRCGLDWDNDFDLRDQTFMDLGHIELVGGAP